MSRIRVWVTAPWNPLNGIISLPGVFLFNPIRNRINITLEIIHSHLKYSEFYVLQHISCILTFFKKNHKTLLVHFLAFLVHVYIYHCSSVDQSSRVIKSMLFILNVSFLVHSLQQQFLRRCSDLLASSVLV